MKSLLVFITLLLIITPSIISPTISLSADNSNSIVKRSLDKNGSPRFEANAYKLNPIWNRTINVLVVEQVRVEADYDGDGVSDIVVNGVSSSGNRFVGVVSGFNGSVIATIEPRVNYSYTFEGSAYAGDNNGNSYPEMILLYSSYNFTTNTTTYLFITWEPVTSTVLANGTITLHSSSPLTMSGGILVSGGYAKIALPTFDTSTSPPSFKTYILSYNVLTGNTSISMIDGKYYDIYSNQDMGDLDGDGVMEYSNNYTVIAYTEFDIFSGGLVSTVKAYYNGNLLFTKELPVNVIPLYFLIGKVSGTLVFEFPSLKINLLSNTTYTVLYAYDSSGSQLYSKNFGEKTFPVNFAVEAEYSVINYVDFANNKSVTVFYSTLTGSVEKKYSASFFLPVSLLPLGSADGGYRLFMQNFTSYKVLSIPSWEEAPVINAANMTVFGQYNALEYPVNNTVKALIVGVMSAGSSTIIGAYDLVSTGYNDTTPPIIKIIYPQNGTTTGRRITAVANVYDPESDVTSVNVTLTDLSTMTTINVNYTYQPVLGLLTADIEFNHTGEYLLTITAVNGAELESSEVVDFIADAQPPIITIKSPANRTRVTPIDFPLTLVFNVSDDIRVNSWAVFVNDQNVDYGFSAGEQTVLIPMSYFREGDNSISVVAIDDAGNIANKTIIVEFTTAPTLNLTIRNEAVLNGFLEGNITLDLYFTGYMPSPCSFSVYVDSDLVYNSSITLGVDENVTINTEEYIDSEHTLKITAGCGNYSMELYSRTIYIDNHAPEINVSLPGLTPSGVLNVSMIEVVNGKAKITLRINASDPFLSMIAVIVDGEIVWSTNMSTSASMSTLMLNPVLSTGNSDDSEEVPVTLDEGSHNISIYAVDKAGHVSWSNSSVIVDLTTPTIEEFKVETGIEQLNVSWRVSDNLSGIDKVIIIVNGSKRTFPNAETGEVSYTNLQPGKYIVTIVAVDNAGNKGVRSKIVEVQAPPTTTTPPSTTTTSQQPGGGAGTTTTTAGAGTTTTSPGTTTSPNTASSTTTSGGAGAGGGMSNAVIGAVIAVVIIALVGLGYLLVRRK